MDVAVPRGGASFAVVAIFDAFVGDDLEGFGGDGADFVIVGAEFVRAVE